MLYTYISIASSATDRSRLTFDFMRPATFNIDTKQWRQIPLPPSVPHPRYIYNIQVFTRIYNNILCAFKLTASLARLFAFAGNKNKNNFSRRVNIFIFFL